MRALVVTEPDVFAVQDVQRPTPGENEVLCKVICHNVCCVIQEMHELGIDPMFWEDDWSERTADEAPRILRMVRPE